MFYDTYISEFLSIICTMFHNLGHSYDLAGKQKYLFSTVFKINIKSMYLLLNTRKIPTNHVKMVLRTTFFNTSPAGNKKIL